MKWLPWIIGIVLFLVVGWYATPRHENPERYMLFGAMESFRLFDPSASTRQPNDVMLVINRARKRIYRAIDQSFYESSAPTALLLVDFDDKECASAAVEMLGTELAAKRKDAEGVEIAIVLRKQLVANLQASRPEVAAAVGRVRDAYPVVAVAAGQVAVLDARWPAR